MTAKDLRLPPDWGVMLPTDSLGHEPLAYRFAGDLIGGEFYLYVPRWIGKWGLTDEERKKLDAQEEGAHLPPWEIGYLEPRNGTDIIVRFSTLFARRWPKATRSFFGSDKKGDEYRTGAHRYSAEPVLLDRYLARASVPFEVRTQYWFCMTQYQVHALPEFAKRIHSETVTVIPDVYMMHPHGVRMGIYDLLMAERALGMSSTDNDLRHNILISIDAIIYAVFDYPRAKAPSEGGFGRAYDHELRAQVLGILDDWRLEATEDHPSVSVGTALVRAFDKWNPTRGHQTKGFERLGLRPRGWRRFRYEIDIRLFKLIEFDDKDDQKSYNETKKVWKRLKKELEKLGERASEGFRKFKRITKLLPFTGMAGWATVKFVGFDEHSDPAIKLEDLIQDPPWQAEFGITLVGLEWDKSEGDGLVRKKGVGHVWGPRPPTKEELVGPLTYVQGEAVALGDVTPKDESKGSFGGKAGFDKAMLGFLGSSTAPAVEFWLDGEVGENTMGASVGVKGLGGYAYLLDGFARDIKLEPEGKEKTDFESYWNDRVARLSVHYPINGARLRAPTNREWQTMFEEGKLSMKEALDTFAACELPLLAHPLAGIKIDGYADPPDTIEDNLELSRNRAITVTHYLHGLLADRLTWGRSYEELKTDGRLVWEAHGEPDPRKKTPKQRRKEEHDPLLRRADVTVQIRDGVDVPIDRRSETGAAIQLLPEPVKKRR